MNVAKVTLQINVSPEERIAFDACAKSHGKNRSDMMRAILADVTGLSFPEPVNNRALSPETIAERFLTKHTNPEVRRALLKALANGHDPVAS